MVSEKPWRSEAALRLIVGVLVCYFVGGLVLAVLRYLDGGGRVDPWIFAGLVGAALACLAGALSVLRKPWPTETFIRRFVTLLVCLYLGLSLGYFAQHFTPGLDQLRPAVRVVVAVLSFQGSALVLTWLFLREHQARWSNAFGFGNQPGLALVFG